MATCRKVMILGCWSSPFALRVLIALNMKSVRYELQEENLLNKSQLLLQSNPVHKKVPVLIHHGKPICESLPILQYIDETWPSALSILPSDPYDSAVGRFWAAYIDDKWLQWLNGVRKAKGTEAKKATLVQVREGLVVLEEAFGKCSKGKDFFSGEGIGYVDIAVGCFLRWVYVVERRNGVKLLEEEKMLVWLHEHRDSWFQWLNRVQKAEGTEAKKATLDQVREGLVVLEEAFGKCSKGKDFFSGKGIRYVDIALGCFLRWVYVVERRNRVKLLEEEKMPGLAAGAHRFRKASAVKDVIPDKDKLLEHANMMFEDTAK